MKKKIIRNGIEMFYCPDCGYYHSEDEMVKSKAYCRKHANIRQLQSYHRKKQWKEENYTLPHRVSNEHKYHFKGPRRIKPVTVRPQLSGVCVLWGKPRYERRMFIDGI